MPDDGLRFAHKPRNGEVIASKPQKTRYQAPASQHEIWLSNALAGTGRLGQAKQMSLMPEAQPERPAGDMRVFYSGRLDLLQKPCVAVVGTRKLSEPGVKRTHRLARELVEAGVTVVSGLAQGVDTVAHTTAIEAGGGTIAVIGTPLDKAYPAENARLQEAIYRDHLLVSQFANGTKVYRSSFPARNKLMATLSDATVIMEASDTSGTLHQAAECTRLGRWLFIARSVVDDPRLSWPTKFLKQPNCVVLDNVSDILERVAAQ